MKPYTIITYSQSKHGSSDPIDIYLNAISHRIENGFLIMQTESGDEMGVKLPANFHSYKTQGKSIE